ncbi:Dabb family protein [Streptomyces sp. DSM 3412]|uniref:Dabb family protein n=1 Tax=Streptomyces gottesmaniae TaxID=3075518 RepID=A0ABU2YQU9_9ACTN|nr:Dabb family protein [Streptomyces sp. DSM 3412]MDT0566268.1 Dabb family protein [Streptomyces sp. DSM 3412]
MPESWGNQGRSNPAVKSFAVGRDHGGDYTYGAVFVVEHLDGLFAYLTHPTTHQPTTSDCTWSNGWRSSTSVTTRLLT